jgi:CelD/BcsL family acetyltransferase involved in cellulose biosynthesis
MHIIVVRTCEALNQLADEWNTLLDSSASHVPFLRHEFISTWWQTLGGGEWPAGEIYVLLGQDENKKLVGIAPFFLTLNQTGEKVLMLLGSIEIADYLDLIARPEDLPAFIEAVMDFLDSEQSPDWRVLDLYNLLENSPSLPAILISANRRGLNCSVEQLQHCPYISLPGDWETYLAGIHKKQRHEIRRKMRRLETQELPYRWYFVTHESTLDAEIDAFIALMAQDAEKERFLTDVMRSQLQASIHAAFKAGWLQLAFVEIDGQKAAGYLNFDFGNHIWVYNSGLNYALGELSPGWVLLGYLLQWAIENGRSAFDFMRGDEDYKYRFGATDRHIQRVTIWRQ